MGLHWLACCRCCLPIDADACCSTVAHVCMLEPRVPACWLPPWPAAGIPLLCAHINLSPEADPTAVLHEVRPHLTRRPRWAHLAAACSVPKLACHVLATLTRDLRFSAAQPVLPLRRHWRPASHSQSSPSSPSKGPLTPLLHPPLAAQPEPPSTPCALLPCSSTTTAAPSASSTPPSSWWSTATPAPAPAEPAAALSKPNDCASPLVGPSAAPASVPDEGAQRSAATVCAARA